jgi:uncharacterized membrane protein
MWRHIVEMAGGPGTLRMVVQPAVAVALGVLHGLHDRRAGSARRRESVTEAIGRILVPLCLAVVGSLVFQYVIRSHARVLIAILYAAVFVAAPYFVTRALTARFRTCTEKNRTNERRTYRRKGARCDTA